MTSRFLYVDADTFLHCLHPNTKLLCLVLLFALVMAFNHPAYEAAVLLLGVALLGLARSLANLARAWRFMTVIFVVSTLLWVFFVKDITEPTVLWQIRPVVMERGSTAYDLAMLVVIAGLLALLIVALSLLQVLVHELGRVPGTGGWWTAVGVLAAIGLGLMWKGHTLLPAAYAWYLVLGAYLLAATVVVMMRLRTPYALALWLGLLFVLVLLYAALSAFLVHVFMPDSRYEWGPAWSLSREALLYGPAMGLRIVAFLTFGLVFISTTRPEEVTQGLRAAGVGLMPSLTLSLAFRLVPTVLENARTVLQAQQVRGLDLGRGGLITRLRRTAPVIVPALAYALRSADDLTRALETRGLGAAQRRTEYHRLRIGAKDAVAVALALVLAGSSIAARVVLNVGELLPRL